MMNPLPTFEGYTIDIRLREFRKVDRGELTIESIGFDSPRGQELLDELEQLLVDLLY